MYLDFFSIPKEVIYYCFIPSVILILLCLIFWIFYRKKKDTYYYVFTLNYLFQLSGIILSAMLLALLSGYAIATIHIIISNELIAKYYMFMIIISFLPIIPLCLLIWLTFKIYHNLKYKKELDENYSNTQELAQ